MRRVELHCSALPAAFTCPPSVAEIAGPEVDPDNVAADDGSAAHSLMSILVDTDAKSLDGIDVEAIARRWDVDKYDLRIQGYVGLKVWRALRDAFPDAQSEVELRADIKVDDDTVIELVGTVDAMALDHRRKLGRQADWKWGRVDRHYGHQVEGYLFLQLANYQTIGRAEGSVCWMRGREPEIEHYSMSRDEMFDWSKRLVDVVKATDARFRPGTACDHCRRRHACPARTEMVRADVLAFEGPDLAARIATGLADLPDADVVRIRRRARSLRKVLDSLDEAVRARVIQAGGVLPDGEGRELRLVAQERRYIDPAKAWPVLERFLTDDELAGCITIHGSRVDDAVAEKTPRGKKKAEIERLDEALRAAEAVSVERDEKLMDIRSKGDDR